MPSGCWKRSTPKWRDAHVKPLLPTHPAFPLVCWLALALTLPRLTPLLLLLVSAVGAVCLGRAVWAASRRVKWLLLTLVGTFAFTLPGAPLFAAAWSPTAEGLQTGALHALRLLVLVWAVRLLLGRQTPLARLAGLWWLLQPLAWCGVSPNQMVVRLFLTLEETAKLTGDHAPTLSALWHALSTPLPPPSLPPAAAETRHLTLQCPPLSGRDGLWMLGVMSVPVGLLGWGTLWG